VGNERRKNKGNCAIERRRKSIERRRKKKKVNVEIARDILPTHITVIYFRMLSTDVIHSK
jgi:hypothetical protein